MKKIIVVFVVAVLAPSLVLAWLALRSLRDQELVTERQQELLDQATTDRIAEQIRGVMNEMQNEFAAHVEALTQNRSPRVLAPMFDQEIRADWPFAEIGFCVTLEGSLLAPALSANSDAKNFRQQNESFLSNRTRAEVYQIPQSASAGSAAEFKMESLKKDASKLATEERSASAKSSLDAAPPPAQIDQLSDKFAQQKMSARNVSPQKEPRAAEKQLSSVVPSDAEFRQIVGDAFAGTVARFSQNKLSVLLWHRTARDPQLVFGAQLQLDRLKQRLSELLHSDSSLENIAFALLDDTGKPAGRSTDFSPANWKRPFVATEVGEALPHWEVAAYLLDPAQANRSAATLRRVIAGMIAVMLFAICAGGWLLAADVRRQLALARQKTDFVSNVSHELKTPLTSIRMFSELLSEGRVDAPEKRTQYAQIISTEASRLTRLINNVLDFARLERGQKEYDRRAFRLDELVEETLAHYRPQLEANGFRVECATQPLTVAADRDAIAQVLLNLISNAEKYGGEAKEISITVAPRDVRAEVCVCDRGLGIPRGDEEKIFGQFHRAHAALNSGIQGAGLGLTLARQIARAHDGDVVFSTRDEGGSCFVLSLPLA